MYFCFSHDHLRFAFTWTSSISTSNTLGPLFKLATFLYFFFITQHNCEVLNMNNHIEGEVG